MAMAMARPTIAVGLRRCLFSLSFASVLLTLSSVSALSQSSSPFGGCSAHEVSISRTRSALFHAPSADVEGSSRALAAAADCRFKASDGLIGSPKQMAFTVLSKISRHVTRFRRSILRAAVILPLLLFGTKSATAPAHALRSKDNTVLVSTDVAEKSSPASKCIKLIVTAGAVAAGAATAKKIITFDDADSSGSNNQSKSNVQIREKSGQGGVTAMVPKIDPSPLPLSAAEPLSSKWIEQQLNDAEKENQSKPLPPSATNDGRGEPPLLVKDLDSKIEMLRAREEIAKADAERKRLDDIEKATEARRQDREEINARIAASAERERAERVRREEERRERLSEPERGMKEGERLEERMRKGSEEKHGGAAKKSHVQTSVDVEEARKQPKSAEEERKLKEKYGNMDLEDRAFNILVDLGMVDLHAEPDPMLVWDEHDENAFM